MPYTSPCKFTHTFLNEGAATKCSFCLYPPQFYGFIDHRTIREDKKKGRPSLSKSLLCFSPLAFHFPPSTTITIRNDIFRITKQQEPWGFSLLISRHNKMQWLFHWGTWKAFLCGAALTVSSSITRWQQAAVRASSRNYGKRGRKRTEKLKRRLSRKKININPLLWSMRFTFYCLA